MAKKGNLFLLVKSLSKSEKRYFKLYAGKGDSNYIKLFEAIDKQDSFDEEALKKHFKDEPFSRQLHVAKIYLSELILKSLRNYHAGESIRQQILDLLRDGEILFIRELYDQALLKIEKAEKLAAEYEKFPLLLEALHMKRRLILALGKESTQKTTELLTLARTVIENIDDLHFYWDKTHHLFEEARNEHYVNSLIQRKPSGTQSLVLHQHLLYSYYFINGKNAAAHKEISKLIRHLKEDPKKIEDDPSSFVTAIGNKISMQLSHKRWSDVEKLIKEMRDVPLRYKLKSHNKFTVRLWLRIFNLEMEMYRDTKQLAKGIQLSREISDFIKVHKSGIPDNYRIMLYFQSASIYFQKKDLSEALKWINEIININFGDTRNELQCYTRVLNLMVHYELGNIIYLRYAVDSCRRFMVKKKLFGKFEKELLALFAQVSVLNTGKPYKFFQEKRSQISEGYSFEMKRLHDYIDLDSWLESQSKRH